MTTQQRKRLWKLQADTERLLRELQQELGNSASLSEPDRVRLACEMGGLAAAKSALETIG